MFIWIHRALRFDTMARKLLELEQELEKIKATERISTDTSPPDLPPIPQSVSPDPSPSVAFSETQRHNIQLRQIGDVCLTTAALEEILHQ